MSVVVSDTSPIRALYHPRGRSGLRQIRRFAKWTGVSVCALLITAWLLSRWWWVPFPLNNHGSLEDAGIGAGAVYYDYESMMGYPSTWPMSFTSKRGFWLWKPRIIGSRYVVTVLIPLWIPFLVIAAPTGVLWYRERRSVRHELGLCANCHYNLAGNTSGVCPECGQESIRA